MRKQKISLKLIYHIFCDIHIDTIPNRKIPSLVVLHERETILDRKLRSGSALFSSLVPEAMTA